MCLISDKIRDQNANNYINAPRRNDAVSRLTACRVTQTTQRGAGIGSQVDLFVTSRLRVMAMSGGFFSYDTRLSRAHVYDGPLLDIV